MASSGSGDASEDTDLLAKVDAACAELNVRFRAQASRRPERGWALPDLQQRQRSGPRDPPESSRRAWRLERALGRRHLAAVEQHLRILQALAQPRSHRIEEAGVLGNDAGVVAHEAAQAIHGSSDAAVRSAKASISATKSCVTARDERVLRRVATEQRRLTPARRAISSTPTSSPRSANASRAAMRMRSRLRCASARSGTASETVITVIVSLSGPLGP